MLHPLPTSLTCYGISAQYSTCAESRPSPAMADGEGRDLAGLPVDTGISGSYYG